MEGRRLLAGECGHAAPEVLGAAARRDRLGLELHLGLEALPRGLVEESLRPAERLRRPLRELARERVHGAPELGVGHDARHESPLERLTGREHAVGEVELHRSAQPHEPREEVRGRPVGGRRDLRVRHREARRLGRDHEVAGEREREPAAGGHAVDRHDHGLVAPGEARHGPVQVGRELLDERADPREVVGEILHVTPRAERLARAGDDHAAHARVVVDVERGVEKLPPERQVERVERVGPVERDRSDPVTAVEDQRLEIHRSLLRVHRLVSDGGDSITDSPRLRLRLRLALRPRDVLRLARPRSQTRLACGCGSHDHVQVRQTRRRASCEATSRISWILSGFTRTRSTPCARRSSAESSTPKPVTMMTGTVGAISLIARATCHPDTRGIARSVKTTSNGSAPKRAMASLPSVATTARCPPVSSTSPSIAPTVGSSSTTRQRSETSPGGAGGAGSVAGAASSQAGAKVSRKVVPRLSSLSTVIRAPCRSRMAYVMESPSPVPCGPLVVKNGSKIRSRIVGEMPTPVWPTVTTTAPSTTAVVSVSTPPSGIASTALRIRFVSASRSSTGSPATFGSAPRSLFTSSMTPRLTASSRQRACVISRASRTTSFRSTATNGWSRRIRVNSCRRRTVCAPSRAARSITWSHWRSCGWLTRCRVSWARPRIEASRLLKSWATPDAISPRARSFSVRTSWSCAAANSR